MTKGIIALLLLWMYLVVKAMQNPWIGVTAYAGFAVLCPPWNWRWGMPVIDYQKFLAAATLLGWLVAGLSGQTLTKTVKLVVACTVAYVALAWISSLGSINPPKSANYLDITWKMALMCGVAVYVLNQEKHIVIFGWTIMLAQGWNAISVNQLYFQRGYINVNNFSWNYLDNNTYSISTVPAMAISIAILMTAQKNLHRVISGAILILQVHQLMLLQSRGTMLGAIVLLAAGVFFMPKNRATLGMTLIAFTLGAILAGPPVVEEFMSSFKAKDEADSSAQSRYMLWKAGAAIMQDYPLLGVGPWAGEAMVPRYYEGDLGGMPSKALHNLFFEVGTGCGVPALTFYIGIFLLPLLVHLKEWYLHRNSMPNWMRMANLSILCGIPGYWVASMFSSGALIESPYLLVVLGCATLPMYELFKYQQLTESLDVEPE